MSTSGRRLVVAIDGPAGAGKSTLARALARALGYTYVDSGAMYRVVGLAARERGIDPADANALAALVDGLEFALVPDAGGQRVLLEGRDVTPEIRTPPAGEWASRVAAIPEVRTRLVIRQHEIGAPETELSAIQAEIEARDSRDSGRAHAPLRAAADAEIVDTTDLSADEVAERLLKRVLERARP